MDQDIHFQKTIAFAAGATTEFFRVPYRCTLRDINGVVQADPGDAETITFTESVNSTALGVLTFGTDIAAGALGTWAADSTDGDHVLEAGELIQAVTSAASAASCDLNIELDPYARKAG